MNIKNLLDHTRLLKFGNGTDLCHSDYPVKGYEDEVGQYYGVFVIFIN